MARQEGKFLVEDFFLNLGGLNTSDSPFLVDQKQATGGKNFDYIKRGGFQKRLGHSILNATPDSQLKTLGLAVWDKPGVAREVVRAAGRKLQNFDVDAISFTNMSEDTAAAGTDFLSLNTEVPVVSSMFNTPSSGVLWHVGGAMSAIYGAYSDSKITANGVIDTAGTTSASAGGVGGSWASTGTYRYAFVLYKASTAAIGNAATVSECSVTVANVTDTVTITLSSLTAIDTTKYTKLYIYRSALSGVSGFTTGDLVKQLDISAGVPATTTDTGTYLTTATNVPRYQSLVLDNSAPPAGPYGGITTFKRRLVVAKGSTLYFSDLNKPESWPYFNTITIPSGGDITGLGVISFNTAYSNGVDELLCIFKQREVWVVTGNALSDWELKFIDNSGCPAQQLIVHANGFLAWATYRGIFIWDGAGKPVYISQSIEDKFQRNGDITKSLLVSGFGVFVQNRNEIQWYLSSSEEGVQQYALKLDLRLTLAGAQQQSLADRSLKAVFTPDATNSAFYAGLCYLPAASSTEELLLLGDDAGQILSGYTASADSGEDYTMDYITPYLNMGTPSLAKRVHKVVLWVLDSGSYDMTLDYWSNYRYSEGEVTSQSLRVSANLEGLGLSWGELSSAGTVTITVASPAVFTKTAHGFAVNDTVTFTTTGALPTGLSTGVNYLVSAVPTADTFRVKATLAGSDVNTSGTQSGTHSVQVATSGGDWDVNYWDTSSLKVKPLTYNVNSTNNNTEGDAFKFRIRQSGSGASVTVYGFSVYFTELGLRK